MKFIDNCKFWDKKQKSVPIISMKSDHIRCVEMTINLLAAYHAVPLDNEQFLRQYRQLFSMLRTMKGE